VAPLDAASLPNADALGAEIMRRAEALALHSEDGPGLTRAFLTPQHRAAAALITSWMRAAGMAVHMDAIGNVVGRYEGAEPGRPALLLGSHQDSVRHGGAFDGMLGIITPISCIAALHAAGLRLPFAIEVIAFGDEEGLRFHSTLLGSRAIAGTFDPADLQRRDADDMTMDTALRTFGLDPAGIPALARRREDVLGFVELHIEQGPVLEARDLPVGVVTAIAGCTRLAVVVDGMAGHAGTVPMAQRRDALAAAAEAVLAIERRCSAARELVGTVGRLVVAPGAANVIPGRVTFSVDIRAPEDQARLAAVHDIAAAVDEIAVRRKVSLAVETVLDAPGCACAPWLMDRLDAAVAAEGVTPMRLFSGAGHDAMAMARLADVGMLFVRCAGGISHRADESITAEDAGIAARVLLRFITAFEAP
jgi:allantoate deiminase